MTADVEPSTTDRDAIALARRDVSIMRGRLIRVWLGGAVRAILVTILAFVFAGATAGKLVAAVSIGGWLLSILSITGTVHRFVCPRCKAPFFARGFFRNPLASSCVHCDLRLHD